MDSYCMKSHKLHLRMTIWRNLMHRWLLYKSFMYEWKLCHTCRVRSVIRNDDGAKASRKTLLHELYDGQKQSPWYDNLRRPVTDLKPFIERGVRGVTSNPTVSQSFHSLHIFPFFSHLNVFIILDIFCYICFLCFRFFRKLYLLQMHTMNNSGRFLTWMKV